MARILNIETATGTCSASLAIDGNVIHTETSYVRNSHAERITIFSETVLKKSGLDFKDLDAISVSMGPGSYTGLRIGVSTAKGYAYALDKPLIAINTLYGMAAGMRQHIVEKGDNPDSYVYAPMIDARRMEVYTSFYDGTLHCLRETKAEIIHEESFIELLANHKILFAGDGSDKCKNSFSHQKNAIFLDEFTASSASLCALSEKKFQESKFEDLAYFEPFYLKDFVAGLPKVKSLR